MDERAEDQSPGPDHSPEPDRAFERERRRLTGLAYRMLGSVDDAEDVVQDVWLRWQRQPEGSIDNPAAWLTTVTTRVCVDRTRELERRRESYVGQWLPEPIATERTPDERAEMADSLTLGFLVVLDRLSPVERAVFLLSDVFGEPSRRIAEIVGKSDDATRQIASRARRKVHEARDPVAPADGELVTDLLMALAAGDADRVVQLLHPDVVVLTDSGPTVRAARRPIVGPHRTTRYLVHVTAADPVEELELVSLNGVPSLRFRTRERSGVLQIEAEDGLVRTITMVFNPDKLRRIDDAVPLV